MDNLLNTFKSSVQQLFFKKVAEKKVQLFQDNFEVIDIELLPSEQRNIIWKSKKVSLVVNKCHLNNVDVEYYEIIYTQTNKIYSFIVYHTKVLKEAEEKYLQINVTLNNLDQSISNVKNTAFEQLKSIMSSLKINSKWTSTHIAAKLNWDHFIKNNKEIVMKELNMQVDDDLQTPLHLAIINHHLAMVNLLLELNPNLNLVDCKSYSILHTAALSTHEIFRAILLQEDMFNRILWKNHQGSTALHLACFAKNYDIVFEFLRFGLTVRMLTLSPPRPSLNHIRKIKDTNAPKSKYDQIVNFTEQDLYDLDFQDIAMAGCPLHWVKSRRLMEKLIDCPFRLDTKNMIGDTPLHLMIKRNRQRNVILLLCSGANVNARNKFGNTPLHHAIKTDEITLAQTLIVFDANINAINNINESVRHFASKESTFAQQVILYFLSSLGAKRCSPQMVGCSPGCSADGTFDGKYPAFNDFDNFQSLFNNLKITELFEEKMNKKEVSEEDKKGVNMLSLDGGGIKGLVVIQVLLELQKHLDRPIIDYFRWVVGTSTGSFIGTFLITGKSLPEIRSIYFRLKDKVFVGDRPYDATPLEKNLEENFGSELTLADLKNKFNKFVLIPATRFDLVPMKLHYFRSYESPQELMKKPEPESIDGIIANRNQLVWKVCRASGAAPTYFKSFGPFIDGGLMANNPTLDALAEFEARKSALKFMGMKDECGKLNFVLSIGTGEVNSEPNPAININALSPSLIDLNNQIRYAIQMINLLLLEITNTDCHIVNRCEGAFSAANILYFRLNPITKKMAELDEKMDFKIINFLWETKRFMYMKRFEVERIIQYLKKYTYFPGESDKIKKSRLFRDKKKSVSEDKSILMEKSEKNESEQFLDNQLKKNQPIKEYLKDNLMDINQKTLTINELNYEEKIRFIPIKMKKFIPKISKQSSEYFPLSKRKFKSEIQSPTKIKSKYNNDNDWNETKSMNSLISQQFKF